MPYIIARNELCDINRDGTVDIADLIILSGSMNFNKTVGEDSNKILCDVNGDGYIDIDDFIVLLDSENYGKKVLLSDF